MREANQCCLSVSRNQVVTNKWTNIVHIRPGNGHASTSKSDIDEPVVLHKVRFKWTLGSTTLT